MSTTKVFNSSFSRGMLISTIFITIFLVIAILVGIYKLFVFTLWSIPYVCISIAISIIIFVLGYSYVSQIKEIHVTDDMVYIILQCGLVVIPRENIVSVNRKSKINHDIRLWGIAGVFGYIGHFYNSQIGRYRAYVKNGNKMVAIKTKNKCYVVSCDNDQELIFLLTSKSVS